MTATAMREAAPAMSGIPHRTENDYAALRRTLTALLAESPTEREHRITHDATLSTGQRRALLDTTETAGSIVAAQYGVGRHTRIRLGLTAQIPPAARGVWVELLAAAGCITYDRRKDTYTASSATKTVLNEETFAALRDELAALSAERRIDRERRLNADMLIHPAHRAALLDPTELDNAGMAAEMGGGIDRISKLRGNIQDTRRWPTTTDMPIPDAAVRLIGGVPVTVTSRGVWLEWLEHNGLIQFDPQLEEFVRTSPRKGRPRGPHGSQRYDFTGRADKYRKRQEGEKS